MNNEEFQERALEWAKSNRNSLVTIRGANYPAIQLTYDAGQDAYFSHQHGKLLSAVLEDQAKHPHVYGGVHKDEYMKDVRTDLLSSEAVCLSAIDSN